MSFEAEVLETTSPTNPGDSGGPLVNDAVQLLGVTQGANTGARGISLFIDVSEVRKILKEHGIAADSVAGAPAAPDSPEAAEAARGLGDADPNVRARAAARLADLGADARAALHGLIKALSDPDKNVRRQAGHALLQLGALERGDVEAGDVRHLRACLRDPAAPAEVQRYAIKALMLLGGGAKAAAPELGKAARGDDKDTGQLALTALDKLGPAAWGAAADLAELLKADDRFVSARAALVLLKADPALESDEAKAAVLALINLQKPLSADDLKDKALGALAGDAVKGLVRAGKPAVPAIRKALMTTFRGGNRATGEDYANAVARHTLVQVIEGMGPKAYSIDLDRDLLTLEERDPAVAVREAARQARAKIRGR